MVFGGPPATPCGYHNAGRFHMHRRKMLQGTALLPLLALTGAAARGAGNHSATHRVRPGDPGWPEAAAWQQLSDSVGGNLLRVQPLFAPCAARSEEHTSELQSRRDLVCRLLLEKKKKEQLHLFLSKKKKTNNQKS